MVLKRLARHLENQNVLHYTIRGFQKDVYAQDAMLRIYEDVYQNPRTSKLRTIAAVDIQAFDAVIHRSILENLLKARPGFKIFTHINFFLTNRTIQIQVDDH